MIVVAALGCGDDDGTARDAAVDGPLDAPVDAGDDAALPSCDPLAMVDLDRIATSNGSIKEALYHGDTTGADRELEPPSSCSDGPGGGPERVHRFTAPAGQRFRVTASTTDTDTPPTFDTVVYMRSVCDDASTQLSCNDDSPIPSMRPLASLTQVEVDGATTMFVVVDGYDAFAFGPYALDVRAIPALPVGASCDPTGAMNACRSGNICTSAGGGGPHCAPGTPPVLGQITPEILENQRSVRVIVAGSDVDADALAVHLDFLDGSGAVLASAERGLGAAAMNQTSFGPLVAYEQDGLLDRYAVVSVRAWLIDAAGLTSPTMMATLAPVTLRDVGQSCDAAELANLCRGELICSGTCAVPSGAASACSAAPSITASMTLAGTLNPTMGVFESSCAYSRGFDDRVYRVSLSAPSDLIVTTDVAPSADSLDTAVYVRTSCTDPASQLGCNDDLSASDPHSYLQLMNLGAGDYFVFVDGSRLGEGLTPSGAFGLEVGIVPIVGAGQPCGASMDGGVPVGRCTSGLTCTGGLCM